MKYTIVIAMLLLVVGSAQADKKTPNPADFPLTARVLGFERGSSQALTTVTHNPNTGVITGTGVTYVGSPEHEEIQIGNIIYTTTLRGRGDINGKVGDTFPAVLTTLHKRDVIKLLGTDKKHGNPRVVTLFVVGQRIAPEASNP